ncbi:hypothetical protein BC938DRAFT_483179 [Jimgerdemannia flammicorona]|uniref:Uncharacterized protein n=1 Tax=Jimgerdemannia flammicorona TaxID=994334 RepID=A0A433QVY9_9FUNG|nr:hypothetical protein BC938DRAFT_483179 [Jimgerdemannia flammicorona]
MTLTQDLAVALKHAEGIDDGDLIAFLVLFLDFIADQSPQLVEVDSRAVGGVARQVEVAHTDLTKVTRMVLIEVDAVVVLTTGKTATSGMFSVLACDDSNVRRKFPEAVSNNNKNPMSHTVDPVHCATIFPPSADPTNSLTGPLQGLQGFHFLHFLH